MFKPLSPSQKFLPGAFMWLFFFEPQRALFKRINWRTGFLLRGVKEKEPLKQPLLLSARGAFPCQPLVCLPLKKESWPLDIHKFWSRLDKPSLRAFLPLNSSEESLFQHWPQQDLLNNLSYYKEP